ncbi:MAG: prolyl oligopeptidase family serine peptidase [Pseudonocardiaceae bacterium]|nr:prolyl oligopeptidase family serine peptidase [Pseudonocardiaceae bacterium]
MPETVHYGDHASQYVEAWLPDGAPVGVAVLVHGGWWRGRFDLHLMDALCADLSTRGWIAWNLEFRRTEGADGGWPVTLQDVVSGIAALDRCPVPVGGLPVFGVGHSAGGHLAVLAATERMLPAVVALAPVTDLSRCASEQLGEDGVLAFIGSGEPEDPQLRDASPLYRLPIGRPQLVVHGDADDRVPIAHSRDYTAAALAAGDPVEFLDLPGADHFVVIDPEHASWQRVCQWARANASPPPS